MTTARGPRLAGVLARSPRNRGRWGEADQTGSVNFLNPLAIR